MPLRLGLALALAATASFAEPKVEFLGSYDWREPKGRFGGFSALHIDGDDFIAVNDAGVVWTGQLVRRDGKIRNVQNAKGTRLSDPDGQKVFHPRNDAEGLAVLPNGDLAISFEQQHRVWRFSTPAGRAAPLPAHADFADLQANSGLEALAVDAWGTIYAIPERSGALDRDFPVYRLANGEWSVPFSVPRHPPHLVVGADIGPDGRLYVLERHLSGIFGFHTRVRRFNIGKSLTSEVTLVDTPAGTHYNVEGISVWRDDQGRIRLTMISDDNFRWFLKTEFTEYAVTE